MTTREAAIARTRHDHDHDHDHDLSDHAVDRQGFDRRAFLKLAGFTLGGAALGGCTRGREEKLIPYLVRPEEIIPGKSYWYASTCRGCTASCGILTKSRDGRPIKLEGLPEHPVSRGGLCAVGQASVLGLYDSKRLRGPLDRGVARSWSELDARIRGELERVRASGKAVRFLSRSITSPTLRAQVEAFLATFSDGRIVEYDPLSASALLDAQEEAYGVREVPRYRFERAEVIVSFDADFLGTWISPVEYTAAYQEGRVVAGTDSRMSWHAQIESRLSVTGSNADVRFTVPPSETSLALAELALEIGRRAGVEPPWARVAASSLAPGVIDGLAARLWNAPRGRTLVVAGVNDRTAQRIVAWLDDVLGNAGDGRAETTIDLHRPSYQLRGSDRALERLLGEIRGGQVGALLVHDVNPVYDLPSGRSLAAAIAQLPLVVSFAERVDETAEHAHFVCPEHHWLESWSDAEPIDGVVTIAQPALRPLGDTRSVVESLDAWAGTGRWHDDLMRAHWQSAILPRTVPAAGLDALWDGALQRGFVEVAPASRPPTRYRRPDFGAAPVAATGGLELLLHAQVAQRDGREAHNAWLQELPDPISKVTWDNYAAIAPETAARLGVETGDVVRIALEASDGDVDPLELPALVQRGQDPGSVAIALGYGRQGTDRFLDVGPEWLEARPTVAAGGTVGVNAAPLLRLVDGTLCFGGRAISVERTGATHPLAITQLYDSLEVPAHLAGAHAHPRPIVEETTLDEYRADPAAGSHHGHALSTLWPEDHVYDGHHWAMAIDLSRCTGCSSCVIACQAENNIPVAGKDEVARRREMSWIRLDRYYSGEGDDLRVAHQPMMCQHCDNAPCENVCPVLATVHSAEGLNQQVYNRCVGTRYCANNCPYKVRRFNWFDYPREDVLQNMVLNPDVTVRSRGVMEKCSFCVQRIQEAKIEARREGRELGDGEIQPACVQSCPARAIVFGDRNDPESAIARARGDPRHYHVLEELNVLPSVGYLRKVRNRESGEATHG